MSTPRPHKYQSNGASRDPCCSICNEEMENAIHRRSRAKAEGVAAPLEPTKLTAHQFYQTWATSNDFWRIPVGNNTWLHFAEAYAAAVSKNLQQSVEQLCGDLQAIQQDYTNEKKRADGLEKEITALREKP